MQKITAILLTLGLGFAATASAAGQSCAANCQAEEASCAALAGASASGNCMDGYRICTQRCDPRGMNSHHLESHAEKVALKVAMTPKSTRPAYVHPAD